MPRPPKTLTEEEIAQVEELAQTLTSGQIADYFGISRDTFYQIMKHNEEVSRRYKAGKAKVIKEVAQNLIVKAKSGNLSAIVFYLKTQAGWSEKTEVAHSVAPVSKPPEIGFEAMDLTNEELSGVRKFLEHMKANQQEAS